MSMWPRITLTKSIMPVATRRRAISSPSSRARPPVPVLVADHADADDVVGADLPADLLQHLEAEAHAVVQAAAVVVGAPVGRRRPEGVQQMAVGFDLDAVHAALAAPAAAP